MGTLNVVTLNVRKPQDSPQVIETVTPTDTKALKPAVGWRRYVGVFYALLANLLFSLGYAINKKLNHIDLLTLWLWAFPAACIVSMLHLLYSIFLKRESVLKNVWPLTNNKKNCFLILILVNVNFLLTSNVTLTLKYIPLADASTIASAAVIAVYFCGWLCLGEKLGVVPVLMAFVSLLGVGIILRPPILTGSEEFSRDTLIGISFAIGFLFCRTFHFITVRYLKSVHEGLLNCAISLWCFGVYLVLAIVFNKVQIPETNLETAALISIGALYSCGIILEAMALQNEEAGVIGLIKTTDVLFAFCWQFVLIGMLPDWIRYWMDTHISNTPFRGFLKKEILNSIVGASIVLLGVITVTLRKWISSLDEEDARRKRCFWLLF